MHAVCCLLPAAAVNVCVPAPQSSQEWSMEELIQAAEATHAANLAIADVEAAFLEGKAPPPKQQ